MNILIKRTALTAAVAAALGSTAAVAAEGGVPAALGRVNTTLNSFIAAVHQLSTKVNQLVPPTAPGPSVCTRLRCA